MPLMGPSEDGALGLEWRIGLHKQYGGEPDFRQQVRSKAEKKGNSIALEGGGRKSKKKWHVKVANYKTNMCI